MNTAFFKSLQESSYKPQELSPYTQRAFSNVIDVQYNVTGSKVAFCKNDCSIHVMAVGVAGTVTASALKPSSHQKSSAAAAASQQVHLQLPQQTSPVERIAWSTIRENQFVTVQNDDTYKIWEVEHNCGGYKLVHQGKVSLNQGQGSGAGARTKLRNFLCQYHPTANILAIITKSNHCFFIDTQTYKVLIVFKETSNIYDFCWSNNGKFFMLGLSGGLVTLNSFRVYTQGNTAGDAHNLMQAQEVGPSDLSLQLFEIMRLQDFQTGLPNDIITQIRFDPCGRFFLSVIKKMGVVLVYDTESLSCIATIADSNGSDESINSVDISKDGANLCICYQSTVKIFSIQDSLSHGVEKNDQVFEITTIPSPEIVRFNPTKIGLALTSAQDGGVYFLNKKNGPGIGGQARI